MAEQINLNKTVYSKNQFEKVIDTSFTQLVEPVPTVSLVAPTISVAEFFQKALVHSALGITQPLPLARLFQLLPSGC